MMNDKSTNSDAANGDEVSPPAIEPLGENTHPGTVVNDDALSGASGGQDTTIVETVDIRETTAGDPVWSPLGKNTDPQANQATTMIPPVPPMQANDQAWNHPSPQEKPNPGNAGDRNLTTWVLTILSITLVFIITPFIVSNSWSGPALIIGIVSLITGIIGTALSARTRHIPTIIIGSIASTLAVLSIIIASITIGNDISTPSPYAYPQPYYCIYDDAQTFNGATTNTLLPTDC